MENPTRGDVEPAGCFAYRLVPPRPDFATTMTPAEAQVMADHAAYWTERVREGGVLVFGAVFDPDGVWGLAVVRAEDEMVVRRLGEGDPAVTSGALTNRVDAMPGAVVPAGTPARPV